MFPHPISSFTKTLDKHWLNETGRFCLWTPLAAISYYWSFNEPTLTCWPLLSRNFTKSPILNKEQISCCYFHNCYTNGHDFTYLLTNFRQQCQQSLHMHTFQNCKCWRYIKLDHKCSQLLIIIVYQILNNRYL